MFLLTGIVRHVMLLFGLMSDEVGGLLQEGRISGRNVVFNIPSAGGLRRHFCVPRLTPENSDRHQWKEYLLSSRWKHMGFRASFVLGPMVEQLLRWPLHCVSSLSLRCTRSLSSTYLESIRTHHQRPLTILLPFTIHFLTAPMRFQIHESSVGRLQLVRLAQTPSSLSSPSIPPSHPLHASTATKSTQPSPIP